MDKLNVLVVDDDRDFAESIAETLELYDHNVELAFTGEQGIEKCKQTHYDIVFMDVRLPGKNGVDSYLEIREYDPHIKVIMMTGYSVKSLLDEALTHGAWEVLHKPLDMKHVIDLVSRVKPQGILIADDDPDFVDGLKESLVHAGYKVTTVPDGKSAIELVNNQNIDILILDIRMPELNGLEVYVELLNSGHKVPTIIMTAFAKEEAESLHKLAAMQVSHIISKPFATSELLSHIKNIVTSP